MKLSAPIYHLKRIAKTLSREQSIPLHEALDRIAVKEGFRKWSLLAAKFSETSPAATLCDRLRPGDLVLIGARPSQGKTLMSLELLLEAMKAGNPSVFFTLEYTERDCRQLFSELGADLTSFNGLFQFDGSDAISADYIVKRLTTAPKGTLAVIDYLQLLDQKRENPELSIQVQVLKSFARERGLVLVFISQINRTYDPSNKPYPDLKDVRLPNPLDLNLFDKTCFLSNGEIQYSVN